MIATDPSTTPPAIEPKWYERPLVKALAKYGLIILVTFLASKGIHLPGELPPVTVNVSYPGPEAAKQ